MANILIVDDHPVNRQFLAMLLGYYDFTIREANDGLDAMEQVRADRPDLIITDLVMPRMDGVAFVKQLRNDPDLAAIPVAFYTASYRVSEAEQLATECGVHSILNKPASPQEILTAVQDNLSITLRQKKIPTGTEEEGLRVSALSETTLDLTKEMNPGLLLKKFTQAVRYLLHAEWAGVLLIGNDQVIDHCNASMDSERPPGSPNPMELADALKHLLGEKKSVRMQAAPLNPALLGLKEPINSLVVVGVALMGNVTGWLYFVQKHQKDEFSVEDERLALTLSGQLKIAYENTSLKAAFQQRATDLENDVTERKQTEATLRKREADLADFFENSPLGICWVSSNGTVLEANRVVLDSLSYSRNEFVGRNIAEFHVDQEAIAGILQRLTQRETIADQEVMLRCKDGSIKHILVNSNGKWEGDRFIQSRCFLRDITNQKLLEDQMRQAQKMEAVGRLAGGIARDFNNLLTIINGYSDMLLGRMQADDPSRDIMQQVHQAGQRAANLTRQLLAFSRKQMIAPVVLNLNTVIDDTGKLLTRVIGEDIDLSTKLEQNLWQVQADPVQIDQVVMNLAVNARDAMTQGGKLTIETRNVNLDADYVRKHSHVQPGEYVMLAVADTGCGMDLETQSKIFEPFFTTKELGKGTGLGLATVYGIVKQNNGSIEVYSEVGVGTIFKIYLPRSVSVSKLRRSSSSGRKLSQGSETILLAEDDAGVRYLTSMILQQQGYKVLEAANGKEALVLARQHEGPVHLLVTDVVMPEMSGPELANLLAEIRPTTKALYLSGYTDESVIRHGLISADMLFLEKPFSPAVLAQKVREALSAGPMLAP